MKHLLLIALLLTPIAVRAGSTEARVQILVPTTTPSVSEEVAEPATTPTPLFISNTEIFDSEIESRMLAKRAYIDLEVGPRAVSILPKNPISRSIFDRLTLFVQPRNVEYIQTLMASAEQGQMSAQRTLEAASSAEDITRALGTFEQSSSMMGKLERTLQYINPTDSPEWTQLILDMAVFESRRIFYLYELERELLEHPVQLIDADTFFDAIYQELDVAKERQDIIRRTIRPLKQSARLSAPFELNRERISLQEDSITRFNRSRRVLMPSVERGEGVAIRKLFTVYDERYSDKERFERAVADREVEREDTSVVQ